MVLQFDTNFRGGDKSIISSPMLGLYIFYRFRKEWKAKSNTMEFKLGSISSVFARAKC